MITFTRCYSETLAETDPDSYGNIDCCESCEPASVADDAEFLGEDGVLDPHSDRCCDVCGCTND